MELPCQLEPCPFCGSRMIALLGLTLRCHHCGASGPFGSSVKQVAALWNERAPKPNPSLENERTNIPPGTSGKAGTGED